MLRRTFVLPKAKNLLPAAAANRVDFAAVGSIAPPHHRHHQHRQHQQQQQQTTTATLKFCAAAVTSAGAWNPAVTGSATLFSLTPHLLHARRHCSSSNTNSSNSADTIVDTPSSAAGGHASTLFDDVGKVIASNSSKAPSHKQKPPFPRSDARVALDLWKHCLCYIAAGRDCIVLHDALSEIPLAPLVDKTLITYTTLLSPDIMRRSARKSRFAPITLPSPFEVRLSVTPATFFSFVARPRSRVGPADKALLNNAIHVRDAVWTFGQVGEYKRCVKGLIAAVALAARAHFDLDGVDPTLGQLLPGAHFFNDELKQWRVPIQTSYKIDGVDATSAMWCADADSGNDGNKDVLARFATLSNQEAIEGTIELMDGQGHRAVGGIQMKMYSRCGPADVRTWSNNGLKYTSKLASAKTSSCVLLFCSGDASDCAEKAATAGLKGKNIVLIGTSTCKALLSPFGASVVLQKLARVQAKRDKK